MGLSGWRRQVAMVFLLGWFLGCAVPSAANPPLTAAAAKDTLDNWNPNFCKVVEFYGFHKAADAAASQVAYVSIINPSGDKNQKPAVYAATFQLLTLADGQQRWFLTSLITHGSGLSRRQGWDNLIIPVKAGAPSPSS